MKFQFFAILALPLLVFTSCKDTQKKTPTDTIEEITDASAEIKRDMIAKLDKGRTIGLDDKIDTSRIEAALDIAAENASGSEAIALELTKWFISRTAQIAKKMEAAAPDMSTGLDFSNVKEKAEIDKLSEKIRHYQKVNAEVKEHFNTKAIAELKEEAIKRGLSGKVHKEFFTGVQAKYSLQLPYLIKIRETDHVVCEAILKKHILLKNSWGKWTCDAVTKQVNFSDEATLESYNKLTLEIQNTAKEQGDAQRALLSTM